MPIDALFAATQINPYSTQLNRSRYLLCIPTPRLLLYLQTSWHAQYTTGMALFGATSATAASNTMGDLKNDYTLTSPPEDGISDLKFSPQSEHLAVASWDKKVRIYEINANGGSEGKAMFEHEGPVLGCCWSKVKSALYCRYLAVTYVL